MSGASVARDGLRLVQAGVSGLTGHSGPWCEGRANVVGTCRGLLACLMTWDPRMSSPVLVGRASQLSTLESALARVSRGGPSAVVIGGEAGVGSPGW